MSREICMLWMWSLSVTKDIFLWSFLICPSNDICRYEYDLQTEYSTTFWCPRQDKWRIGSTAFVRVFDHRLLIRDFCDSTTSPSALGPWESVMTLSLARAEKKKNSCIHDVLTSFATIVSVPQIANSAERFCCKELDFDIGMVWLHPAYGMLLDPLEINGYGSDCLAHLDRITSAVLTICCGKMQQIRTKHCQQWILSKIGTKSTTGKDNGTKLLKTSATLFKDTDVRQSAQQHVFFDEEVWKPTSVQYKRTWKSPYPLWSSGSLSTWWFPMVNTTMGKSRKKALRVSSVRSLEILKFFTAKMVVQITPVSGLTLASNQQEKCNKTLNNTYFSSKFVRRTILLKDTRM